MDNNYVFQYWEAIENGTVTVGKWIRTIYKILVDGLKSGKWDFDGDKANKAINFIENFCHHSEGRNDLLKLELWQKAIVSAIFGIMDKKTGYRQFREVFIVVARKNGKTLFAAAIAEAERCNASPTPPEEIANSLPILLNLSTMVIASLASIPNAFIVEMIELVASFTSLISSPTTL